MKIFSNFVTTSFAALVIMTSPGAATRLFVYNSTLTLHGSSTLHDFECTTKNVQGVGEVDLAGKDVISANIIIPVKSIHSESALMDKNMYAALKADNNSTITFTLLNPAVIEGNNGDSLHIKGNLTVAGKTRAIDMSASLAGSDSGTYRIKGTYDLLMTDYGVVPPTFMFGAMKTSPKVSIRFDLSAK